MLASSDRRDALRSATPFFVKPARKPPLTLWKMGARGKEPFLKVLSPGDP
jgi:hypothetical protein